MYFDDIKPALKKMNDEQCGRLLRAVVSYAETGEQPEMDGMEALVFEMLSPKIDRDGERYEEQCDRGRYATYAREKKNAGEEYLTFAEWKMQRIPSSNNVSLQPDNVSLRPDNYTYPTTITTPTATASTTASTTTTATTTPSTTAGASGTTITLGKGIAGGFRGEEGENKPPHDLEEMKRKARAQMTEAMKLYE